jgi:hypothetical protein
VEAENPTQALEDAREPFGELLDEITAHTGAPLRYSPYSVAESPETHPLAFEVHVPFLTQLSFDQGMFLPPLHSLFTVPNALIREGLCSESPYYRLLCAYRLRDAIGWIRGQLGKAAASLGKGKLLPALPAIVASEILQRGAELGRTDEEKEQVRPERVFNLMQLFDFWTNKRNSIAHLFQDTRTKSPRMLVPSIGRDYRDFAASAAILLYYSHAALNDLRLFTAQYLQPEPHYRVVHTPIGQDPQYLGALLMSPENPKRGG